MLKLFNFTFKTISDSLRIPDQNQDVTYDSLGKFNNLFYWKTDSEAHVFR